MKHSIIGLPATICYEVNLFGMYVLYVDNAWHDTYNTKEKMEQAANEIYASMTNNSLEK